MPSKGIRQVKGKRVISKNPIRYPLLRQSCLIQLHTREGVHNVLLKDIIYCCSDNSLTTFHILSHNPVMVSKPLIHFEMRLRKCGFARVHNKRLVNLLHITCLLNGEDGHQVEMTNGEKIGISRSMKKNLIEALQQVSV